MKYLIASLVGAVIGYFTNWLAIKMLFRPHQEKKLFGIKVPFTPGLIPKERVRIAKSVGETVGTHLLTGEAIKKALSGEKMNKQLKLWICNIINNLKNSTLTIGENIKAAAGEKYNEIILSIEEKTTKLVFEKLREQKTREKVFLSIEAYITEELKISPKKILETKYIVNLKSGILNKLETIKNSEEFNTKLNNYINEKLSELESSEKTVDEIVPEGILEGIKSYIYSNREDISSGIGEMLKEPDIENRIKQVISSIISSNLSPMIAMFINPDTIYGKLSTALQEYLLEDENQRNVVMTINQTFDRIVKKDVAEILSSVDDENKENNIKEITQLIINKILTKDLFEDIMENIKIKFNEFESLDDFIRSVEPNYKSSLNEFLEGKINSYICDNKFESMLEGFVHEGIGSLLNARFNDLINQNEEIIAQMVMNVSEEIFHRFIENGAAEMVGVLNIPEIVEERINSFDVEFTENIIIDIAKKELNAITWLGALLGGLIGILSPLLQNLY
jgi:uncharacterized membrane protein YheB (UPF0754 family)